MKILWFANTPCGASSRLLGKNYTKGGWLLTLEQHLSATEGVELSVAFYWVKKLAPFREGTTDYYPVLRSGGGGRMARILARYKRSAGDPVELGRLLEVVALVKPDVIHIHGTEDNYGLIQSKTKIPVVVSLQGLLSVIALKYFAGIPLPVVSAGEGLKAKLLASSIDRQYRRLVGNARRERVILSLSRNIVGRTEWDRQVSRLLAPDSQYFEIHELLRPLFEDKVWSKTAFNKPLRIVSTMGPGVYKGLETIVQATQLLMDHTSIQFEWWVAGLERKSRLVGTVGRWLRTGYDRLPLHFAGPLGESELVELLISCDVYCQSSHIENSPNSLCEAMLLGLPCVASAVGGTPSLLRHGVEGLLVQDGDPYALAGALFELYNDFSRAASFGSAARQRALKRHNPDVIVQSTVALYRSLI